MSGTSTESRNSATQLLRRIVNAPPATPDVTEYAVRTLEPLVERSSAAAVLETENQALREERDGACALLRKCFDHFGRELRQMPLNESAGTGTQAIAYEVAEFLDKAKEVRS